MRLIDADKLQRTEGIFTYRFTDDLDIMSCCAYRYEDVETAPTVKAIPIEWIEKWVDKKTGTKIGDEIGYLEEDKKLLIGFIYWLVRDWEKENGN